MFLRVLKTISIVAIQCLLFIAGAMTTGFAQNYTITGRILDQNSGETIEYASITTHNLSDSTMLTGVVSDASGQFQIKNPVGTTIYLNAQFLGYGVYTSAAFEGGININLGDISKVLLVFEVIH